MENIKSISSKLYTGILQSHKPNWLTDEKFIPHMTIGKFDSKLELDAAFNDVRSIKETYTTMVNKVSVEIIDDNEDSIIEFEVELSNV